MRPLEALCAHLCPLFAALLTQQMVCTSRDTSSNLSFLANRDHSSLIETSLHPKGNFSTQDRPETNLKTSVSEQSGLEEEPELRWSEMLSYDQRCLDTTLEFVFRPDYKGSNPRLVPFPSATLVYTHLGRLNHRDDRPFRRADPERTSEGRYTTEGSSCKHCDVVQRTALRRFVELQKVSQS